MPGRVKELIPLFVEAIFGEEIESGMRVFADRRQGVVVPGAIRGRDEAVGRRGVTVEGNARKVRTVDCKRDCCAERLARKPLLFVGGKRRFLCLVEPHLLGVE